MTEFAPTTRSSGVSSTLYQPGVRRDLARVERRMLGRMAYVHADGFVQGEKLREIDRLTETAMFGQAMLSHCRRQLAGPDIELHDELRFFTDVARLGTGEVIVGTIQCFTRSC
jgi:hypothetical protein